MSNALPLLFIALAVGQAPLTWEPLTSDPSSYALMRGGQQIGHYDSQTGDYRPLTDGPEKWGQVASPPIPAPVANHGVNARRISPTPRYWLRGERATKAEVEDALLSAPGGADLPNPPAVWVTVIGPDADRARVLGEIEKVLARPEIRGRVAVSSYHPDHWSVNGTGFVTTGRPTVYVQDRAGKVIHRQDNGADAGEAVVAALRQADPSYAPTNDRDLRQNALLAFFRQGRGGMGPILIVGALVVLVLLASRNPR